MENQKDPTPVSRTVGIKPLEWDGDEHQSRIVSSFGYHIEKRVGLWMLFSPFDDEQSIAESKWLPPIKAIAQSDYENRVRAAVVKQAIGECLAGMTHSEVSQEARRKIEKAINANARFDLGGLKIALAQAWKSNREREAEINKWMVKWADADAEVTKLTERLQQAEKAIADLREAL